MRDLVRARAAGAFDLRVKRQQAGAFLLGLGRVYPGKKTWGGAHRKWLASQAFAHLEQRIAFEELIRAMDEAKARVARLEKAIEEAVADGSLAPTVMGLMAMRGIDLVAATTILAELGDIGRFQSPRELMAWLGLARLTAQFGSVLRERLHAIPRRRGRRAVAPTDSVQPRRDTTERCDKHCAAARAKPRQGNSRGLQVADRRIDARLRRRGAAPDETRTCGTNPRIRA